MREFCWKCFRTSVGFWWSAPCECGESRHHRRSSPWSSCRAPHHREWPTANGVGWCVSPWDPCWRCRPVPRFRRWGTREWPRCRLPKLRRLGCSHWRASSRTCGSCQPGTREEKKGIKRSWKGLTVRPERADRDLGFFLDDLPAPNLPPLPPLPPFPFPDYKYQKKGQNHSYAKFETKSG